MSESINIANNVKIKTIIDELIGVLIRLQNEGKDPYETKYFIKNYIGISGQSIEAVLNWLRVNQNESKYIFLLGFFYHHKFGLEKSNNNGFLFFLKAAEDSYPSAQVYLSVSYKRGFGTEVNDSLAFNWMQKAAENQSIIGQNFLGCYYKAGIGTEKNSERAFYWYQKAAKNGHIRAQNNLALFYNYGEGTEKNLEKAFYWYHKSG